MNKQSDVTQPGGGQGSGTQGGGTPGGAAPPEGAQGGRGAHNEYWSKVQQTRAWAGFLVVAVSVAGIAFASYWGISKAAGATNASSIAAIISSGFTAIATATTAYFGIRAVANTAQSFAEGSGNQGGGNQSGQG